MKVRGQEVLDPKERLLNLSMPAGIVAIEAADQEDAGSDDEWHVKMARYLRRIERAIRQLK
jgi:hypothetical protein